MPAKTTTSKPNDRELLLTSTIDAPRDKVYRCWTEPALIKQWFTPPPWTTPHAETDVRPGGSSLIIMRGPDGQEMPHPGVYLEVVPNEKLVATDAFVSAWKPSEKPFMTLVLTFETAGNGRTKYTAHEKMGFEKGWTQATAQLAELAGRI